MKVWWSLLLIIHFGIGKSQQISIAGVVSDESGEPIAFVSVYEKGTSNATLTNDDGRFELDVVKGSEVIFQFLGYTTQVIAYSSSDANINIVLKEEVFTLSTVEISADREDPAYEIIRQAIKRKDGYYRANQRYKADLYVKGILKLKETPESFMGQDLGTMGGILDTNRQGILYLSETQSTVLKDGNKEKEILHSSIVSGNDNGIGFNQFINSQIDFYGGDIDLTRSMIGPLDDAAFNYYRFRLERQWFENGQMINHIKVIPKSAQRPCLEGDLYILSDTYRIHSLDLKASSEALNNSTFEQFRIRQTHAPVDGDEWRLITQSMEIDIRFFMFRAKGDFFSVYSDYDIDPDFPPKTFSDVTFIADEKAINNDTAFWNAKRPVPLTAEEKIDYIVKDSLSDVWNSKEYLDSIDRRDNKFSWSNLIFGYSHRNRHKKRTFSFDSPLMNFNFNAIEGFNLSLKSSYSFIDRDYARSFRLRSEVGYGFTDKRFKPYVESVHWYDEKTLSRWGLRLGRRIEDYSDEPVLSEFFNSYHSLAFDRNFVKFYQRDQLSLWWKSEIVNSLSLELSTAYEERNNLSNHECYADRFEPNFENISRLPSTKTAFQAKFTWFPAQKRMVYPNRIVRLSTPYPTFRLMVEHAVPIQGLSNTSYTKLELNIEEDEFPMGKTGFLAYHLRAGAFLDGSGAFPDVFHFAGGEVFPKEIDKYQRTFKLLPYYSLDDDRTFANMFMQHHFKGFISDLVPGLNWLGWNFVVSSSALVKDDVLYHEHGIGLEDIKIGPFNLFRVDYYWGFNKDTFFDHGFRLGYVNILQDGVRL